MENEFSCHFIWIALCLIVFQNMIFPDKMSHFHFSASIFIGNRVINNVNNTPVDVNGLMCAVDRKYIRQFCCPFHSHPFLSSVDWTLVFWPKTAQDSHRSFIFMPTVIQKQWRKEMSVSMGWELNGRWLGSQQISNDGCEFEI